MTDIFILHLLRTIAGKNSQKEETEKRSKSQHLLPFTVNSFFEVLLLNTFYNVYNELSLGFLKKYLTAKDTKSLRKGRKELTYNNEII